MLAEVVFVTRFLGLVNGMQPVVLQADASVQTIELHRDAKKIATLRPPWSTRIDFGPDITPHTLTAIAFDADGKETGRDSQIINLARPPAEVAILIDRSGDPWTAHFKWTHVLSRPPVSMVVTLDGKVVRKGKSIASLPLGAIDKRAIHVIGTEIEFDDDSKARKETAFGGVFSEEMPAELTPVVAQLKSGAGKDTRCFSLDGSPVTPTAIEKGRGEVYVVILKGGLIGRNRLKSSGGSIAAFNLSGSDLILVSPVAQKVGTTDRTDFFRSATVKGEPNMLRLLAGYRLYDGPVQGADAVAGSAVQALASGRRRAVVLVIAKGDDHDLSKHAPAVVRRFLQRIGVPLYVWSIDGASLETEWGTATDVSSIGALRGAATRLGRELEAQRVAWFPVPPLEALRITSSAECGLMTLAK